MTNESFNDLRDKIYDFTQNQTAQEKLIIPELSEYFGKITDWFDRDRATSAGVQAFYQKIKTGRVPFDHFEKFMQHRAPNRYPSASRTGFNSIIKSFTNTDVIEDVEEKKSINDVRFIIHKLLLDLQEYLTDEKETNPLVYILDTYTEVDTSFIRWFRTYWEEFIGEDELSLRDQLIGLRIKLNDLNESYREAQFSITNENDIAKLDNEISSVNGYISRVDSILLNKATETAVVVERLPSLLSSFEEVEEANYDQISKTSEAIRNPLYAFVSNDYLKAQTSSVSRLATGVNAGEEDLRDAADDVSQSTPPDAETTPASFAEGDKTQEEQTVSTIQYKGKVGPLSESQYSTFINVLGKRESNNNYSAVNTIGFSGRWQFGAAALIDMGYVKSGASTRKLGQTRWWKGRNGISSRQAFLSNSSEQDKLMLRWTKYNYKRLLNVRAIKKTSTPSHVAGMLAVCHLLGPGGARDYVNGKNKADAYGTKASDYYNLLSGAIGGATTPANAKEAETYQISAGENTVSDGAGMSVPQSEAAPVYPYNKVKTTESGHYKEYDDTPGSERIAEKHRTGTGYETNPDGSQTVVVKGSRYTAILANDNIIVSGDVNIYVEGTCGVTANSLNVKAKNDLSFMVGGDVYWNVGGSVNEVIGGNTQRNVSGDSAETVEGYKSVGVDGDMQVDAASLAMASNEGNVNFATKGKLGFYALEELNIVSGAKANIVSQGDMSLVASGKGSFAVAGDASLYSGGSMTTHGDGGHLVSSNGQTSIAGSGTIAVSHPVEKAEYSDTAGQAPDGTAVPVTPSAGASDGGGSSTQSEKGASSDKDKLEVAMDEFESFDLDTTQGHSGGTGTYAASTKEVVSVA